MKALQAERVLIAESLSADRACRARLDAMLARVHAPTIDVVPDVGLERELRALGSRSHLSRVGLVDRDAPKQLVALGRLPEGDLFPGYSWREQRSGARQLREHGVLCQTAIEVQSVVGCPFNCAYCPYASFICARLDVAAIVERIASLAASRRCQALYKLNNRSDTLGLEPEYGLASALIERFARLDGKYLLLYSKGDAVAHLLDLDHRGKTIASFTLTPAHVASRLETGAPSPEARIRALGRLYAAGYPVRLRFSPIVPIRGWRTAYRDLLAAVARVAMPEMVTLWTLSMIEVEALAGVVPLEELDEEILAAAWSAADTLRGQKGAPFPPTVRRAIYTAIAELVRERWPETEVALCLETPEVWDALTPLLVPRTGGRFRCNCGPRAISNNPRRA